MTPFVTPLEVKNYTEYPFVASRLDAKLKVDISRAEIYVKSHTNNDFSSYEVIPEAVKTAVILIAEAYVQNIFLSTNDKKSETFDDYSYTVEKNIIDISTLGLEVLLDEFIIVKSKSNIEMKLRKL